MAGDDNVLTVRQRIIAELTDIVRDATGVEVSDGSETWLTVEICVLFDSPHVALLRDVCADLKQKGLPVYVSVSKRGTPFKAG